MNDKAITHQHHAARAANSHDEKQSCEEDFLPVHEET